jgi:nucleotide-binding universal stress UspA family protein
MEVDPRHYHQAVEDFRRARRQASLQQTLARLRGESSKLLGYDDIRKQLKVTGIAERGIREIPVSAIVGSVGRSGDFTRDFMPANDSDEMRWANVKAAFLGLTGVPPIEVYQIGDAYFVKDGNHRVSVARQLDMPTIEAYVTEVQTRVPLSPEDDPEEIILKARYANFLEKTNLDKVRPEADLQMTWPGYYSLLLEHIDVHRYFMGREWQREVPYEEAVGHWYDEVYLPTVALLYERGVFHDFPERTEADLYALLADYRRELGEQLGWEMDVETAVSTLADEKGEQGDSVLSRVGGAIAGAVVPAGLEPGPKPGIWREERLEPFVPDTIFKDILVAVGGEESHWRALTHGIAMAVRANGRLLGLFVAKPDESLTEAEKGQQDERLAAIRAEFDRRCAEAGLAHEFAVDWDESAADAILRRSVWADLVVFANSHPPQDKAADRLRSGLTPLLQRCSRPLLAVPPGAGSALDRMLLAYDGSPKAEEGLFIAAYRAMKYGTSLVVLVVADNRVPADTANAARAYLEKHGVEAEVIVRESDNAGDEILDVAQAYGCNMLIMGGFGRRPFWRIVVGSLVDRMLREFPQPILISR